jgi:23S rRNA pseudouridine2604 synthase
LKAFPIPIKNFLVQTLKISNKEAIALLAEKRVLINEKVPSMDQEVLLEDTIKLEGQLIKHSENYIYLLYYKPRGIETTLNKEVENNLADALNLSSRVFPVGRLDKESEGLLFLTNDGTIFNRISHGHQKQEKEYLVQVDKPLSEEAIQKMEEGIVILGKKTFPANVYRQSSDSFKIILTQGLNKQIRRMCYKLNYEVTFLKRIRIMNLELGDLLPGQRRPLSQEELAELFSRLKN